MKSSLPALPLLAMALLLAALILLDLAFDAAPEVYIAFLPALVWAGIIVLRGRG
jgi:hypothetical protein